MGGFYFRGGSDRSIFVWEREDGRHVAKRDALVGHGGPVLCLVSVVEGGGRHVVVSGSSDRTVRVWTRGGRERKCRYACVTAMEGHERPVKSLVAFALPSPSPSFGGDGDSHSHSHSHSLLN